ncbi:MAG: DNA repair protein RecO [Nitrospinae bacterium]|nr:DNA repair protein RecO [Nitrospinota bacterium]
MPLHESTAVTIKSIRLGEADRIVTLFTERYGKIKAVAKGALKPKSRFGGRLEPFVHGRIIFYGKEKAELFQLNTFDVIEPFLPIRDDLDKMSHAFVSAELCDYCQKERDVNREGLRMLLGFWRALSAESNGARQDLLLRLFEFKYLSLIGFMPRLSHCVNCGKEPAQAAAGFNARKGGVVCADCVKSDNGAIRVSLGSVKLLGKSLETPMEKLSRLAAGPALMDDVERMVHEMVETHVRRRMKSERFLRM